MSKIKLRDSLEDFHFDTAFTSGRSLKEELLQHRGVVLYFLRYQGCPVCQMHMARINQWAQEYQNKGYKTFVVLQSTPEILAQHLQPNQFNFEIISDPKASLFDKMGVSASWLQFMNPKGLVAVTQATLKGHKHGKFEGRENQMPAVFVVDAQSNVKLAYYGKHIDDILNADRIQRVL